MPPPLVTPSPHRFVIKKPAPVRKTPSAEEANAHPSTQQFKTIPRFTISSTPRPTPTQSLPAPTPSATRFATPVRRIQEHEDEDEIENIESSSFERPIHGSIETDNYNIELEHQSDDDYNIEERNPKRRRLSSSSALLPGEQKTKDNEPPSSLPILSSPPSVRRPLSTAASRFMSTPFPISTPNDKETHPFLKPPRFRPPDPSEQTQTDPLPEQFSPHRRGQKYFPGGLASEVRDWLVNMESTLGPKRDGEWVARVLVDEVAGGWKEGMTMVRGRQVHADRVDEGSGVMKVMLAGEGLGMGLQRAGMVEVGKIVGIKWPVWEVMLEEEQWGVGVEWKVLG